MLSRWSTVDARVLLAMVLGVALLAVLVGFLLARAWARWALRRRMQAGRDGESTAERILADAGFQVIDRQRRGRWRMNVDGRDVSVSVRADLVVSRGGETYVAEVKTGTDAPDPASPATRRQLLEYSLVFGAPRVVLVDVPAARVHIVRFPEVEFEAPVAVPANNRRRARGYA